MSYTIAVPSSSIQKVLEYGLPTITSTAGGVAVSNGTVTITSLYTGLPVIVDSAYAQANIAYAQANTATGIASAAYSYANTLAGGSATDNVARVDAQNAYNGANTYFASTQNSITYITGVNLSQNTSISLAFARANTSINTIDGTSGVVTTSNGRIVFQSTNGMTITGSGTSFTFNSPQALRTSDSPTFNSLNLTNPLSLAYGGTGSTSAASALTTLLPTGTVAGYVLTTGGPGTYYWSPGGSGGGGGAVPGTTINSTRLSYIANGSGFSYTTPTYVPGASQLRVYFDGVRQFASEYTEISSSVVTFSSAVPAGISILVEVDGFINNPYYANNISFTAPFGGITGSANTIQLAIQDLESRKATLAGPSFTGVVLAPSASVATSNTQVATTGFAHTLANSGMTFAHSITGLATTATTAAIANDLNISNNYRVNSLGVGAAASGTAGEIRATTITESSSITLKENINPIVDALESISKLNGVTYDRKDGSRNQEAGLIAEDVFKILPNMVTKDQHGNVDGIAYTKLTAYLIEAVKELKDEIKSLKGIK